MKFIPLFSGSSGNSSYLEVGSTRLLIDAGMTGKAITEALCRISVSPEKLNGILVTHDHVDHTRGVGILSRKYGLPVYANAGTLKAMEPITKELPYSNTRLFQTDEDFYIGSINIFPFKTPHDAAESVGFVFTAGEKKLTYMTDIGCMRENMLNKAAGSNLVFIEANHDIEMLKRGPYPYPLKQRILSDHGHLSNENCGKALVKLYETGVRFAVLGHLSKENNTEYEAYNTVSRVLEEANIPDMRIVVAKRGEITGIFEL
ncbi:MAG: MBL fold metallo-hydrolase [Clostridia bacterium]|nr:MBL fold metallo-hydrolase [Clostridia bacterium]